MKPLSFWGTVGAVVVAGVITGVVMAGITAVLPMPNRQLPQGNAR